jgi:hypothetical protein
LKPKLILTPLVSLSRAVCLIWLKCSINFGKMLMSNHHKVSSKVLPIRTLLILPFLLISACGGSDSSSPNSTDGLIVEEIISLQVEAYSPIDSSQFLTGPNIGCDLVETDANAVFNDVSFNAGLCYETTTSPLDGSTARVSGGIAVSDYNSDGRMDIYVTHGRNNLGKLFSLQADGRFFETTQQAGITSLSAGHGGAFLDINLDGLPDLLSIQEPPSVVQVFANNGDGSFTDISESTGLNLTKSTLSVAAGDHDLDGDLDLFFTHWDPINKQDRWEFLWQNQGAGNFIDVSDIVDIGTFTAAEDGDEPQLKYEYSFTPVFADFNNDRFPDILLSADYSYSKVLVNNAGAGYVDFTPPTINDRSGMGATVADYDNDGDLDWYVSAIGDTVEKSFNTGQLDGSRMYQNDGQGNYTNVTDAAGVRQAYWGWGTCFADFNNDGFQDLFAVNGYDGWTEQQSVDRSFERFNNDRAVLYINNGDSTFTERGVELGITHTAMGRGLVCHDYDRDGDLDMLIANSGESPSLFRNNSFANGNNFLNIQLKGTRLNPQAVGAQIYITVNGKQQMRELQLGNNYVSQSPVEAHFGIAENQVIEKVLIVWPGLAAQTSELNDVQANQFLVIYHPK